MVVAIDNPIVIDPVVQQWWLQCNGGSLSMMIKLARMVNGSW